MHSLTMLRSGQLARAKHLKISESLAEFPPEIYQLADSLEVLDLSNNQLTQLPDDLHRFSQLKVLFASNNPLQSIPKGLIHCNQLKVMGFKHCQIKTVPEGSLPLNLRWLILTDNQIETLPDSLGDLVHMEKLALAGNQLKQLPASMVKMTKLGLLRISANKIEEFPDLLLKLPELAWLAFAGNPFCAERDPHSNFRKVSIADLDLGEPLGRGASGVISRATWQFNRYDLDSEVAVKVFHGDITSDGYPEDELDACLSVPEHPNLVGALARIQESESSGLVMRLIPADYYNLGQPPSLESCTRDVFTQNQSLTQSQADALVQQMTGMVEHLEDAEVCHGDLYAHNTLVAPEGNHLLFGDFGAASKYHHLNDKQKSGIRRIERRSLAYFVEDVQSLVGKSRFD